MAWSLEWKESKRRFTMEQIDAAMEDQAGLCIACGGENGCVEPDARMYVCEHCGDKAVYGAEELVMMGMVD